jgi:hypothetical protein
VRDETGSMLPLVAALVFVGFVIIALGVDIALLHRGYRAAAIVADTAAEAGAAMVDVAALHEGRLELAMADALTRATEVGGALAPADSDLEVEFDNERICVRVEQRHTTVALGVVGVGTVTIDVRSCAEPRTG